MQKLITFDGASGSGKTTQMELLDIYLKGEGYSVLVRERCKYYEQHSLIPALLDKFCYPFVLPKQYHILRMLGRLISIKSLQADLVRQDVSNVLIDSWFWDSFVANPGNDELLSVFRYLLNASEGHEPDVSFYIDVPTVDVLGRLVNRDTKRESTILIETEEDGRQDLKNKEGIEWLSSRLPYFYVIDGIQTEDVIFNEIISVLGEEGVI